MPGEVDRRFRAAGELYVSRGSRPDDHIFVTHVQPLDCLAIGVSTAETRGMRLPFFLLPFVRTTPAFAQNAREYNPATLLEITSPSL